MFLAIAAVFITWSIMDLILHGFFLKSSYEATAHLWRPMAELNISLIYLVTLTFTASFVLIYGLLVGRKTVASGIQFGALFGLAAGVSMGFGSYNYMPIPLTLAWGWFIGNWLESVIAGAIAGAILRGEGGTSPRA